MRTSAKKTGKLLLETIEKKLRKDILSGVRLPRERLIEKDLSEAYLVNRMIIRQALLSLEKEGLIVIEPYKGASVAEIPLKTIIENYQIISMLMGYAASLAVENITKDDIDKMKAIVKEQEKLEKNNINEWERLNSEFHRSITLRCGNEKLIDMIRSCSKFASFWYLVLENPERLSKNIEVHKEIIATIEKNNSEKVGKMIEKHIAAGGQDVINAMKSRLPIGVR